MGVSIANLYHADANHDSGQSTEIDTRYLSRKNKENDVNRSL